MARKKKRPSPVTFKRHHDEWCIVGPDSLVIEGILVRVRKKSGHHELVRVLQILDTKDGQVTAAFINKELPRPRHFFQNPKRRGRSK